MCSSGDDLAKQSEQLQLNMQKQLLDAYTMQFGKQSKITDFITNKLQPQIDNPQGMSPEALTAARATALENVASQYANASKAERNREFALGGRDLPSGVNSQIQSSLDTAAASDTSKALNQIDLTNEDMKNANYWNAVNALSGNAAMLNPQSYAGETSTAGSSLASLSQAYNASKQSQLMSTLGGIVGGGVSAGLGGYFGKKH